MLIPAELLRQHLEYHAWANRKLVEATRRLPLEQRIRDFGTADRNVLGTLVHIFAADRLWIARVEGNSPTTFIDRDRDLHFSVLDRDWSAVDARWAALSLAPETIVTYQDLKGKPFESELWKIVLHVVNHGTHHRGQVAGFLRAMGQVPPPLDLMLYYRETP